ncbi:MAG: N4-gp56 family major capsid protein [Sphaerochaeta sp.]|jgi:N4-gp56 family major capsid protein|nr:N4-gp56 family major capsid protein [Sphaerochaeta sp.]
MGATEFALNDALAVQRWSTSLAVEAEKTQYFRKFMGTGPDNLIVVKTELQKKAGEKITVGLRMKLAGDGIEGDNVIEGTSAETALDFYSDYVFIDQRRKGTKSKGKMTEQRVPYNLRKEGRDALAVWWAEDYDEQIMMYMSGARGVDTSFHVGLGYTGRANNSFATPDTDHRIFGGNATGLSDIDSADKMKLGIVEKLVSKIETLDPMIQPFRINGENKYVLLMHTFNAYDLRTAISQQDWLEIHKATDGAKSPIYQNALGEYGGIILHKHRNVIRFDDSTGCASGITASRCLLLGAQSAIIAWGGDGGEGRYTWNEETDDRGNALAITAGTIYGVKKSRFNSKDFGIIAIDCYCVDPN